jgi:N-acetyl-anhydromuramyl-L-alanine amidase AmpD
MLNYYLKYLIKKYYKALSNMTNNGKLILDAMKAAKKTNKVKIPQPKIPANKPKDMLPKQFADTMPQFYEGGLWDSNKKQWVDSVNNANIDKNFINRMYLKNGPSIQIPGEPGRSTHFMEESDNMVYPTVVQRPGSSFLEYLNKSDKNGAYNYARMTGQFIKFPNAEQAAWYANNGYKKGTNVLKKKKQGGPNGEQQPGSLSQSELAKRYALENEFKKRDAINKQGTITTAPPKRSAKSKAWAIATNPMTALQYKVRGERIPENFERGPRNVLEYATDILNPYTYAQSVSNFGDAVYDEIRDPSINGLVNMITSGAQALPVLTGSASAIHGIDQSLIPYIKQAARTFKKTGDIPSLKKRLQNAVYSGSLAKDHAGDFTHHSFFDMTPEEVASRIAYEKKIAKPGAALGDYNMSLNSTPLYWRHGLRDADQLKIVRTGEMQGVNTAGFKGKRINQAIPQTIKDIYKKDYDDFKIIKDRADKMLSNGDISKRDYDTYLYENDPTKIVLNNLKYQHSKEQMDEFLKNYKPELDNPIIDVNKKTGLNFPMSDVGSNNFFRTPTSISIKNPNARLATILKTSLSEMGKDFSQGSGLNKLNKFFSPNYKNSLSGMGNDIDADYYLRQNNNVNRNVPIDNSPTYHSLDMSQLDDYNWKYGGYINSKQNFALGGSTPIYTDNPKDPRLRAYNDSLKLYNRSDYFKNIGEFTPYVNGKQRGIYFNEYLDNDFSNGFIAPIGARQFKDKNNQYIVEFPVYKKPVQPVIYRKPKPKEVAKKKEEIKQQPVTEQQFIPIQQQASPTRYEGQPVYAPTPYSPQSGALVGFKTTQGDTMYIKPEDYQRMGVPGYGREFIEKNSKRPMKNGGSYKGPSIVDYLASRGYEHNKGFRKNLADKYGVNNYDFSADKNLELLAKLRENDDLLETYQPISEPMSFENPNQRRANMDAFRQKLMMNSGADPLLEGISSNTLPQNKFSLSTKVPNKYKTVDQQQPIVKKQEVVSNIPLPAFNPYPFTKQLKDLPKKATAANAAKHLEKNEEDEAWYENLWNSFSESVNNNPYLKNGLTMSGAGFTPEGAKNLTREVTLKAADLISSEKGKLVDNYYKRKDLKDNPNLQETKTKFDIPTIDRPAISTGDTININKNRYVIPAMIDLNQTKWGTRNRDEYKDINTEAGDITTFQSFENAKDYFAKNPKDIATSTYIGVDPSGNVKVGNKNDFVNSNYRISKTFGNKIVDFVDEPNGSMKLKNSSSKASNKHLSPVIKVLGDDGKMTEGSMNLLIPKGNKDTKSFGQITGGRVIFKTPKGDQFLVSGSAEDIRNAFKQIKGDNPYVEAITLDNGSYAMGLRNKNQKITAKELRDYQGANTTGSAFLYLQPGNYTRSTNKNSAPQAQFKDVQMTTPNIRTQNDESFRKGHSLTNEQKAIVLHHTGYSDTAGLSKGMSNAMKGVNQQFTKPGESSHVVIDFDGTRYNYARPDQVTFHAGKSMMNGRGNVNDFSVGIEFQGDTNKNRLTDKQINSFVEYAGPIIKKNKIPLSSIITHKQIRSNYMKANPTDKEVLGKPDVNDVDYQRIITALKKKGYYKEENKKQFGGTQLKNNDMYDFYNGGDFHPQMKHGGYYDADGNFRQTVGTGTWSGNAYYKDGGNFYAATPSFIQDTVYDIYRMFGGETDYQEPLMEGGGYVVSRSNDRKGKTHKVTGPDGTVKYFGDSKLGQHPNDPERKAAFYARHEKNLDNNPFFRAFARKTWEEGGEILEMERGGEMIRRADGSYSRRGLWDNIRANKGSGRKPTAEMLRQEREISQSQYGGEFDQLEEAKYGGIHIKPSKRGTFTAAATKHGMGVQAFANRVLANKENYSPAMVKKANFARNASKWKHEYGGPIEGDEMDVTPEQLEQLRQQGYQFEILD